MSGFKKSPPDNMSCWSTDEKLYLVLQQQVNRFFSPLFFKLHLCTLKKAAAAVRQAVKFTVWGHQIMVSSRKPNYLEPALLRASEAARQERVSVVWWNYLTRVVHHNKALSGKKECIPGWTGLIPSNITVSGTLNNVHIVLMPSESNTS